MRFKMPKLSHEIQPIQHNADSAQEQAKSGVKGTSKSSKSKKKDKMMLPDGKWAWTDEYLERTAWETVCTFL